MGGGGWNHMMNYGYGYGGMFMWILFIIVIGVVVYFIIQSTKVKTSSGTLKETPLDILKGRYAKGEIAKEEFERMKKDLEG
ncbi:MAG: SHOCT domain-containing protein [Deltaproteobacteria bacterium]|nr:SHOCT domain-containing protein [Deltaproteobacteria bacterium]